MVNCPKDVRFYMWRVNTKNDRITITVVISDLEQKPKNGIAKSVPKKSKTWITIKKRFNKEKRWIKKPNKNPIYKLK